MRPDQPNHPDLSKLNPRNPEDIKQIESYIGRADTTWLDELDTMIRRPIDVLSMPLGTVNEFVSNYIRIILEIGILMGERRKELEMKSVSSEVCTSGISDTKTVLTSVLITTDPTLNTGLPTLVGAKDGNSKGNDSSGKEVVDPIQESILEGERMINAYMESLKSNPEEVRKFFERSKFEGNGFGGYNGPTQEEVGKCIIMVPDVIRIIASHSCRQLYLHSNRINGVTLSFVLWFWIKNGGSIKTLISKGNDLSGICIYGEKMSFDVYKEWFYNWFKEIFLKLTLPELIDIYNLRIRGNILEGDINRALFIMIYKGEGKNVIDKILHLEEGKKCIIYIGDFVKNIINTIDSLNMGQFSILPGGDLIHVSELAKLSSEINIPTVDDQLEFIDECMFRGNNEDIIQGVAKNRLEALKKVIIYIYKSLDNDQMGERIRESIKSRLVAICPELFADAFQSYNTNSSSK